MSCYVHFNIRVVSMVDFFLFLSSYGYPFSLQGTVDQLHLVLRIFSFIALF